MAALRRYTRQFQDVTGIDVHVDGPAELALSERAAAELFEMTTEALSNVRRHTAAQHVAIGVERRSDTAYLSIENDGVPPEAPPFDPRSLGEHAEAMGGTLDVRRSPGAATVRIRVPL